VFSKLNISSRKQLGNALTGSAGHAA
jgi:hypothetical protein